MLGFETCASALSDRANKIDKAASGLYAGLWQYGCRFITRSVNDEGTCRGACYWVIDQMLSNPNKPVDEIAEAFRDGAPEEAKRLHRERVLPERIRETCIHSEETSTWPPAPNFPGGVYTVFMGFSESPSKPSNAHRVVLISGQTPLIFDPNTGLAFWHASDWNGLLDHIASDIRTSDRGFFTIRYYKYDKLD